MKRTEETDPEKETLKTAPVSSRQWSAAFLVIGGALLLVIGITVRLGLGLSAASDQVFAVEALWSGIGADLLLRRLARRKLVIAPSVQVPLLYVWPLLCAYVFVARPFE